MEYRSNIIIACEEQAYNKIKKVCKDHFMPTESKEINVFNNKDIYFLSWDCVKWYGSEVDEIENALKLLDNNKNEPEHGYVMIQNGEDNCYKEKANNYNFCDFYKVNDFFSSSIPAEISMARDTQPEHSAEILASLLMDDNISTARMWEDLCSLYEKSTSATRNGINEALNILIGCNMNELAEKMLPDDADTQLTDEDDEYLEKRSYEIISNLIKQTELTNNELTSFLKDTIGMTETEIKGLIDSQIKKRRDNESQKKLLLTSEELELIDKALDQMGDKMADTHGYSAGEPYWNLNNLIKHKKV